jgi:PAS domain S-box-containing protein
MAVQPGDTERLVVAAHVAHTISQELARYDAEARNRATEELYETVLAALDAEQRARGGIEAALGRAQAAEAALQESQARLSLALDNSGMGMWEMNLGTGQIAWSEQTAVLFGLPRRETSGALARLLEVIHPDDHAIVHRANECAAAGGGCDIEFRVIWPDGTVHWINGKGQVGPTTDGSGLRLIGICQDITERKRLMSALEVAQRQKDAIVPTVAHELRQPLGAIRAALALMQTRISREKGERARAIVERQVQQLTRMVEDLLDAARIAQGKVTLHRKRTALNSILDAAVSTVQPLVRERGQRLEVTMPADVLWLDADPERLQQVFSNLLTNASKFTEPAGSITVSVEPARETVDVRVRDTGQGIAAEMLPRIFDLFSQAEPDAHGLGIGLALVRELVQRHDGTVEAHSEGSGAGSEFVVRLPRAPASI